jgi:hypothetical protein
VAIAVPERAAPLVVDAGVVPYTPNAWCARAQVYRGYVRLEDVGLAGATFGVAADGALDWVPPQDAGCVDWARVGADANLPAAALLGLRLERPLPGALLWVLAGDAAWQGRLYEVGADGRARYVSAAVWAAQGAHFAAAWPNVLPVAQAQVEAFAARGLVGPDL